MRIQPQRRQSPVALVVVAAAHVALIVAMLHHQPRFSAAEAALTMVSVITPPRPAPVEQPPEPPRPKVKRIVKKVAPPPIAAPSPSAISVPPAPPAPPQAEVVATAPPARPAPAPPAPIVLPRFDADYLQNPPPSYPAQARRMGEQGRVLLRVVVRPDGMPDSVVLRQSSGSARLDEAALEAVRKWRFVPARQGSTPVTAAVIVPIVFSLAG